MVSDRRLLKKFGKIADKIIALEPKMRQLKDEDFILKTQEFKQMLENGKSLDDILIETYAVAREAARRVLGLNAYKVQLIGGIILNSGDIAEMRTGEGKTLTGIFPAYLNALSGKGVHIVTVNEYLSKRDSEINGKVFDLLGISVGLNGSALSKSEKREAYNKDITYTTNAELGFDYLRDNMVSDYSLKVQRKLNYCIIDEADSVLIDEARTPLIISGGTSSRINLYKAANNFALSLKEHDDLDIDLESKQVYLNEQGMRKANEFFSLNNLFAIENTEIFHLIMNALKAQFAFKEGVEYTVRDNEILLIDQFTGRIMQGRSYSDGLQQALQAKENVEIEEETVTLATITYQNFYRLYSKIAGMTGTAKTEEEEFIKIYNTRVIQTPTNKPVIRKDEPDLTFGTKNAALKKLVEDVLESHKKGAPILIGTTSVESSEQIARYLKKANLKFETINAKNHDREAEIVAKAGEIGAITLATNMAGRGTDIKLAKGVAELGGLRVFGVERNEARRIDNQLRGRSGRQGDPGLSRFYISMDDDLMMRFTAPKTRQRFKALGDDYIKSKMFTRAVTNAQKKLEGMNFDQRKNVLDYDNILAQQREIIYAQRDDILEANDLSVVIEKMQITAAYELIEKHSNLVHGEKTINKQELLEAIDGTLVPKNKFRIDDFNNKEKMDLAVEIADAMMQLYKARISDIPDDVVIGMERKIILDSFDKYWTKHLDIAGKLKSGIYLQQYAQNNPLAIYVEQATDLFNKMKVNIANEVVQSLANVILRVVEDEEQREERIEITDKDIEEILYETGLQPTDINNKAINDRFDELEEIFKDDKQKLRRLRIQRDVMLGLVLELERRAEMIISPENDQQAITQLIKELQNDVDIASITIDQINQNFNNMVEQINDPEKLKHLIIAKDVLLQLVARMDDIKEQEKQTKKRKKKKPHEDESTKTKIG
ncbi:preprotein translocase subunit SecA [Mycoplasma feriruminatoris]|uniref:Protein translocase subunit SecA n=1 Tax=Mycoplasma feriruminatoris TaxID=1179777 RepID=A0AAQ3DNW8_9MOLU|nr:preprotein translocase subunit SecA [Mycoplasma feriruminatoris]UKS54470.1 preprotein translocase, SecA subunit [Mycoplasma feriruminatoris]WFQ90513.1 Protein translocase subunit SecA [Mycoplasma feriruminatoris]WFQ91332.1 preprotein translocase subunit SecA [Mycoplasma feriruminatoris]WFQ92158.1 Protein translocase subunit SecA [Mycoplasma feriruminatoris]WFQ92999.1 Protein translocase subunit SecA [Mycoplasma feriruminatoris]